MNTSVSTDITHIKHTTYTACCRPLHKKSCVQLEAGLFEVLGAAIGDPGLVVNEAG